MTNAHTARASSSSAPPSWSTVRSSRRSWLATVLGAALAVAGAGCGVSVEADAPDVAVTQHDVTVTGIPMASQLGEVSSHVSFTQSLPDLALPSGFDSSVDGAKLEFTAKKGITDFSFINALHVTVTPNGSTTAIEIIDYQKAAGTTVGKTLTIDSKNAVDLLKQWKDKATFDVQVAGMLPENDWTIDLTVRFNGKVSYKY